MGISRAGPQRSAAVEPSRIVATLCCTHTQLIPIILCGRPTPRRRAYRTGGGASLFWPAGERRFAYSVALRKEGRARQELEPDQNMYQMCGDPAPLQGDVS